MGHYYDIVREANGELPRIPRITDGLADFLFDFFSGAGKSTKSKPHVQTATTTEGNQTSTDIFSNPFDVDTNIVDKSIAEERKETKTMADSAEATSSYKSEKEFFIQLIASNKLGDCIFHLSQRYRNHEDAKIQSAIIMISNQYSSLIEKKIHRSMSEKDIQLEERQIAVAILSFLELIQ